MIKEIKLYENTWSPSSWSDEKTEARRLICEIVYGVFDMSWVLKASVDISQESTKVLGRLLVQAYGGKVQSYQINGSVFEIKFRGSPWRADGTETVQTRLILLTLLECLEQQGFSLYAGIDQDNGPGRDSHASEADTWFCNRQADWTPGAPIYHG
ncbi:hypothetical protein V1523DRAFT_427187 [Lipomyces doorenjongii]